MSTYCAEVLSPAPVQVLLIRQRPEGFFLERLNERSESVGTTARRDGRSNATGLLGIRPSLRLATLSG